MVKNINENSLSYKKTKSLRFLVVTILVIVIIISCVLTFIRFSSSRTERSVHDISEFYLEELANNVSNVCKSHFNGYFKELELALLSTKELQFQNKIELEKHMKSMAERGNFLYYALLDENGNIYISDEDYRSQFLIDFILSSDFENEEVVLETRENADNVIIIGLPAVENTRINNGIKIVAGVKGISTAKVKEEILLQTEGSVTYAHMIKTDGSYVIAGDNASLVKSDNYFTDLADSAVFPEAFSLDEMKTNIQNNSFGSTAYYVGDNLYYGYYTHLSRSGWALVVTIPYEIVSNLLSETANRVTFGGLLLSFVISILFVILLRLYYMQKRVSIDAEIQRIKAEERTLSKSRFLSSVSHDIRTPMNAIIGYTNLAIEHERDENVFEYLTKINIASNHLLGIINDVLDMSKIESGKMKLEEMKCNLGSLFSGLDSIVKEQIAAKNQNLQIDVVDIKNENVLCDKLKINQVLLNLLSNAVKFTPEGGTIEIGVRQKDSTDPDFGEYEFRVKDTGIGMSKEFCEKIFEPFERENSDVVKNIQGTGLGMSIVKNIVDLMGGTIKVNSELNKGTEFILNLRLKLDDEPYEESVSSQEAVLAKFEGKRILLVEDNEFNSDIATNFLKKYGFIVDVAVNGQIAVEKVKASVPGYYDLILMDIKMPVMNGYEAAEEIRYLKDKELSDIPIVAMTANAFEEDIKASFDAGMNAHISKPFEVEELLSTLSLFIK